MLYTIFLACQHYPSDAEFQRTQHIVDTTVASVFMMELCLRLTAFGTNLLSSATEFADAALVTLCFLELFLSSLMSGMAALRSLRAVRALRVLLVLRAFRHFTAFRYMINALQNCVESLVNYFGLLLLLYFIFAVSGMSVLGGNELKYDLDVSRRTCYTYENGTVSRNWCDDYELNSTELEFEYLKTASDRSHYNTLASAFVTVLQVSTLDWVVLNWREMGSSPIALGFHVMLIIIVNFMMFNLLLAVIVDSVAGAEGADLQALKAADKHLDSGDSKRGDFAELTMSIALRLRDLGYDQKHCEGKSSWVTMAIERGVQTANSNSSDPPTETKTNLKVKGTDNVNSKIPSLSGSGGVNKGSVFMRSPERAKVAPDGTAMLPWAPPSTEDAWSSPWVRGRNSEAAEMVAAIGRMGRLREPESNRPTECCPNATLEKLIAHWTFEVVSFFMVAVSCVLLSLESPGLEDGSQLAESLKILDLSISIFFGVEAALKIFGMGYQKYFADSWNRLDFFIVIIAFISMIVASGATSGAKAARGVRAVRAMRALRALRVVTRVHGLRVVVETIFKVLNDIWTSLLLSIFVVMFFAILGTHLFCGMFWHCNDGSPKTREECVGVFSDRWGNYGELQWVNRRSNFDNVGESLFALFRIATLDEGWIAIVYSGVDAVGQDEPPMFEHNMVASLYFMVFIFAGAFVCISLIVGQIINLYAQLNREEVPPRRPAHNQLPAMFTAHPSDTPV